MQWVTVVFYDVFFTSLWSDHHISSLYLVWEMTCQFWVQWWRFWMQWVAVVFYDVFFTSLWSDHNISSLYLVWEMTCQFWVQWWRFSMQWFTVVFDDVFFTSLWSDHHISSLYMVWEMTSQFWVQWSRFWMQWVTVVFDDVFFTLGKPVPTIIDEFLEKFQTAFDHPPHFRKVILRISRQKCVCSYGGTVVYYMILYPMRCM